MKKKLLPLLAFSAIIVAALVPVSVGAVSYNPGYTCSYRDIAGSCLSYQTQNPIFLNANTYPFRSMINAKSVIPSKWDNQYSNYENYYRAHFFESDSDNNDYLDDYDDVFHIFFEDNRYKDGTWQWYFDDKSNTYKRYRYQSGDHYKGEYGNAYKRNPFNNKPYEEFEYIRYYSTPTRY